jgi:sortase (surface protein transpeptidase)
LADDGSLAPPESASRVGWFSQSSRPGELGPVVFVGHLDSLDGPAVFAHLQDLVIGDVVRVGEADGSSASYVVSAVDLYPRESFPTEAVYGATPESSLRLITCGGPFERGTGYADNVVVAAAPVEG